MDGFFFFSFCNGLLEFFHLFLNINGVITRWQHMLDRFFEMSSSKEPIRATRLENGTYQICHWAPTWMDQEVSPEWALSLPSRIASIPEKQLHCCLGKHGHCRRFERRASEGISLFYLPWLFRRPCHFKMRSQFLPHVHFDALGGKWRRWCWLPVSGVQDGAWFVLINVATFWVAWLQLLKCT